MINKKERTTRAPPKEGDREALGKLKVQSKDEGRWNVKGGSRAFEKDGGGGRRAGLEQTVCGSQIDERSLRETGGEKRQNLTMAIGQTGRQTLG